MPVRMFWGVIDRLWGGAEDEEESSDEEAELHAQA
jgi:hypothetical protein